MTFVWVIVFHVWQWTCSKAYPNFLIILADDLGWGDAGMFGSPTIQTPNIDRLIREGMKFTQFYGEPLCTPSRGALMTGRLPVKTGLYTRLPYPEDNYFRVFYPSSGGCLLKNETTLPEYLRHSPAKYWCGMVGKWHLGHQNQEQCLPLHRGFDSFFGLPYSHEEGWPIQPEGLGWPPVPLYDGDTIIEQPVNLSTLTPRYNAKILAQLDELAISRQPFFFHIAYEQPHVNLFASPAFQNTSLRGAYGDAVNEMDHSIGLILDKLDATGLAKNTLVFFASDNSAWIDPSCGFPQLPNCSIQPWDGGSNGPLFDGKGSTYEGGDRVMAVFLWPGMIPSGTTSMSVASMYDVLPTLLEWAQVPVSFDVSSTWDGHSLIPMLTGKNMTSPTTFWHYWRENTLYAIRYNEWKCHWYTRSGFGTDPPVAHNPCLLFQINYDPGERIPLNANDYSDILKIMNTEYAHHVATTIKGPSQYENQDWQYVPCCNGTVTIEKMDHLMHEGIVGLDMWKELGCYCLFTDAEM